MSADAPTASAPAFSPRTILILVLVGVVAFAGLAVLAAYAPELRNGNDGRAHALSKSAIGYAGAPILMTRMGRTAVVSRIRPHDLSRAAVVLTPDIGLSPNELKPFASADRILIVLPKWFVSPDPIRKGYVRKGPAMPLGSMLGALLADWSKTTATELRRGESRPVLRGAAGGPFAGGTYLPLGPVDRLQTISGEGWAPALVDESGRTVLAYSRKRPGVWVLADPDLLNNHGLASLDTARAGAAILDAASGGGARSLVFDVTLNGYAKSRGLWRMMLEPPWLAATLIALAVAVLMGVHALARFGQPTRKGRAFALGARALVDNSADLIRMARKEHELAPAYAALTRAEVLKAAGGRAEDHWLDELANRRGATAPDALAAEAQDAKTREDLLAVAKKLYEWRGEMTRERR